MTTITIKIEAPELAQAILLAAERLSSLTTVETTTTMEPVLKIGIEAVRAKLASLTDEGKNKEVVELLNSFGAKKLSEIPKDKYAELLIAARAL